MKQQKLTQAFLKAHIAYDAETGIFTWRVRRGRSAAGTTAGWIGRSGHRYIKVGTAETTAARLAWLYAYGSFPLFELSHVNGNAKDCRISNLREMTPVDQTVALTHDRLLECLIYNSRTGSFTWTDHILKKVRGKLVSLKGERSTICIDRHYYKAHRVAWFYVHGRWPGRSIDHINGNPLDNRISNLREATQKENMANSRTPITNKSGYKGVSWHAGARQWQAHIRIDGKSKYLGLFQKAEDGHAAYCKEAIKTRGKFARFR